MWNRYASLATLDEPVKWARLLDTISELENPRTLRPSRDGASPNPWLDGSHKWTSALSDAKAVLKSGFSPTAQTIVAICALRLQGFSAFREAIHATAMFFRGEPDQAHFDNAIPGDDHRYLENLGSPHLVMAVLQAANIDVAGGQHAATVTVAHESAAEFRRNGIPFELTFTKFSPSNVFTLAHQLTQLADDVKIIEKAAKISIQALRQFLDLAIHLVKAYEEQPSVESANLQLSPPVEAVNTQLPEVLPEFPKRLAQVPLSSFLHPYREAAVLLLNGHSDLIDCLRTFRILPPDLEPVEELIALDIALNTFKRADDDVQPTLETPSDRQPTLDDFKKALEAQDVWIFPRIFIQRALELANLGMQPRIKELVRDRNAWLARIAPHLCCEHDVIDALVRLKTVANNAAALGPNALTILDAILEALQSDTMSSETRTVRIGSTSIHRPPPACPAPRHLPLAVFLNELQWIQKLYNAVRPGGPLNPAFLDLQATTRTCSPATH